MWLGMQAKSGTACSSPAACDGYLFHHMPGETSASNDDIAFDFVDSGWMNTGMSVDTKSDSEMCLLMSTSFEVQSTPCSGSKKFYCKIPCEGKSSFQKTGFCTV